MKKRKIWAPPLLLVFIALATSIAAADTLTSIRQRMKILIAVDIGVPPFGMLDSQANQVGSDIETAKLLAKDLGVNLEIVPVVGVSRIPFLLTKKVDVVIASFVITEDRKKMIDFSVPYGVLKIGISGPTKPRVEAFVDLKGKTIAATRGTTADQELVRGVKDVGDVTIVRYEDDATTSTAVASGHHDYIAAPVTAIPWIKKSSPSRDIEVKFVMQSQPYAIGLRKGDAELKAYLDGWVRVNMQNGKLNGIFNKYFGSSLPAEIVN